MEMWNSNDGQPFAVYSLCKECQVAAKGMYWNATCGVCAKGPIVTRLEIRYPTIESQQGNTPFQEIQFQVDTIQIQNKCKDAQIWFAENANQAIICSLLDRKILLVKIFFT